GARRVGTARARLETSDRRLRIFRLELALADRLVELRADAREALLHQLRVHVDENDVDAVLRGHLRDAGAHLSGTHHRQGLHVHAALPSLERAAESSTRPGGPDPVATSNPSFSELAL